MSSPIYYFTLSAQIQAPIQHFYSLMKPSKQMNDYHKSKVTI